MRALKAASRKEQEGRLGCGHRVRRESLARKYRNLPEGLPRAEEVEDLLLPVGGDLEDLHPARDDHVKPRPLVAFGEDPLPLPGRTPHADPGQRLVLRLRKAREKGDAGKLFDHIYHVDS